MRTQSRDISEKIEKILIEKLRSLPAWRKAEQVKMVTITCQRMALIGLRNRYPDADENELKLRLGFLWLDKDTMKKVDSWDTEKRGL
jgi:hypothetical protein